MQRVVLTGEHDIGQIGRCKKMPAHKQIPAALPRGFFSVASEPGSYFKTISVNG